MNKLTHGLSCSPTKYNVLVCPYTFFKSVSHLLDGKVNSFQIPLRTISWTIKSPKIIFCNQNDVITVV
jgi:hypothetical protein